MAEYRHDRTCVPQLAVGAEMHLAMIDTAFEAKDFAISISPDAPPYGEGYIASFEVDGSHVERIAGMRRATAHLRNTSRHAVVVEVGNDQSQNTGRYVLARTAAWVGRT